MAERREFARDGSRQDGEPSPGSGEDAVGGPRQFARPIPARQTTLDSASREGTRRSQLPATRNRYGRLAPGSERGGTLVRRTAEVEADLHFVGTRAAQTTRKRAPRGTLGWVPAVVGIDLGTSNTVVAHASERDVRAIVDADGRPLIPSVISFHPSKAVLVGYPAKDRRVIDSKNTIASVKRLIGRTWGSPEVEEARKHLPYELRAGRNRSLQILAREQLYSLPEISAFVLRKAKSVAEGALGTAVDRAVITVPANFNDLQREATKLAGALAGLDVLRILNEPTAAALAYGITQNADQRLLVYDFGGGTFDVTLLQIERGVFRVLATAGDMFLGGEDIDMAIANKISESFLRRHYYDPRANREVFQLVRDAAEGLKMQLSEKETANLDMQEILVGLGGKAINFTFTMTRDELTLLVLPFVDRTIEVCRRAMATAGWSTHDVEQLLLVGGSTRLTAVGQRIADLFGRAPAAGVSPDDAVALGAAIQAAALAAEARPANTSPIARAARENAALLPPEAALPAPPPPPAPSLRPSSVPLLEEAPRALETRDAAPVQLPPGELAAPPTYTAPSTRAPRRRLDVATRRRSVPAWVWLLIAFFVALGGILFAGVRLLSPN